MKHHNLTLAAVVAAPFGAVRLYLDGHGELGNVGLTTERLQAFCAAQALAYAEQVERYLLGEMQLTAPLQFMQGTPFQQGVWRAMADIPLGQTVSYKTLAQRVDSAPRAVANACGANPLALWVPCHRVVASNGLGGFMQGDAQGLQIKRWLLQHEEGIYGHRFAA
jgi:methylated-DNA-[protein]-cysteine S-methyltransferase